MVGTYPLVASNQFWSTPTGSDRDTRDTLLQFPDENSEGVYNAALALLGKERHIREYGLPFDQNLPPKPGEKSNLQQGGDADPQRRAKSDPLRPPVWITVVGRDRFLPVGIYDETLNDKVTSYTYALSRAKAGGFKRKFWWRGLYPPHTTILVGLFSVLCLGFCWFVFKRSQDSRLNPRPACAQASEKNEDGPQPVRSVWSDLAMHRREALIYLVPACASLAAFLLPLNVSLLIPWIAIGRGLPGLTEWNTDLLRIVSAMILASVSMVLLVLTAAVLLRRTLGGGKGNTGTKAPTPKLHFWGAPVFSSAVVFLMAAVVGADWLGKALGEDVGHQGLFTSIRSLDLLDGVSPLVPLFFISMAGFLWSVLSYRRRRMFEAAEVATITQPDKSHTAEPRAGFLWLRAVKLAQITRREGQTRGLLECSALGLPQWWFVAGLIIAGGAYIFTVFVSELERTILYSLLEISFVVVSTALWFGVLRFCYVWKEVQQLLQQVACTPLRRACKRFRATYPVPLKLDLASPVPSLEALSFSVDQAFNLNVCARRIAVARNVQSTAVALSLTGTQGGIPQPVSRKVEPTSRTVAGLSWLGSETVARQVEQADSFLVHARGTEDDPHPPDPVIYQWCAQGQLALLTGDVYDVLQDDWWNEPHPPSDRPGPEPSETAETARVFELAEDFLVGRLAHFLGYILPQMQQLIFTSVVGVLLLLLAVHFYPFQPHNLLLTLNWAVVLSLVGIATWVFIQMSRDPVLSYLNGTKPGQISWDREFVIRIFAYGVVPILALLGAQFPESIGQIVSHIVPSEAIHR